MRLVKLFYIVLFLLAILKLFGIMPVSWWLLLAPFYIPVLGVCGLVLFALSIKEPMMRNQKL